MKKRFRFLRYLVPALAAGAVILMWGLLWHLESDSFRSYVEGLVGEELGTEVRIDAMTFDLVGEISVVGIAVGDLGDSSLEISVERMTTGFGLLEAALGRINRVKIEGPVVRVVLEDPGAPKGPSWLEDLLLRIEEMAPATEGPLPEVVVSDGRLEMVLPDGEAVIELKSLRLRPDQRKKSYLFEAAAGVVGSTMEVTAKGRVPVYDSSAGAEISLDYRGLSGEVLGEALARGLGEQVSFSGGFADVGLELCIDSEELSGSLEAVIGAMRYRYGGMEGVFPPTALATDFRQGADGGMIVVLDGEIEGIGTVAADLKAPLDGTGQVDLAVRVPGFDLGGAAGLFQVSELVPSGSAAVLLDFVGDPFGKGWFVAEVTASKLRGRWEEVDYESELVTVYLGGDLPEDRALGIDVEIDVELGASLVESASMGGRAEIPELRVASELLLAPDEATIRTMAVTLSEMTAEASGFRAAVSGADLRSGSSVVAFDRVGGLSVLAAPMALTVASTVLNDGTNEFRVSGLETDVEKTRLDIKGGLPEGFEGVRFGGRGDWGADLEGIGETGGEFSFGCLAAVESLRDSSFSLTILDATTEREIPEGLLPIRLRLSEVSAAPASGTVEVPEVVLTAGEGTELQGEASGAWGETNRVRWDLTSAPIDLEKQWPVLAPLLGEGFDAWMMSGRLSLAVRGEGAVSEEGMNLRLDDLTVSVRESMGMSGGGEVGWQDSNGRISMKGASDGRSLEASISVDLEPHAVLVGTKYMDFGEETLSLSTDVVSRGTDELLELRGEFELPGGLQALYAASVNVTAPTEGSTFHLAADGIDLASVAADLTSIFFAESEPPEMVGRLSVETDLSLDGDRTIAEGRIDLASGAVAWGRSNILFFSDVDAGVPFRVIWPDAGEVAGTGNEKKGQVRIEGVGLGSAVVGPLRAGFLLWNNRLELTESIRFRLFGGSIEVDRLKISDIFAEQPREEISCRVANVSLEEAFRAFGLPATEGEVSVRIPRIHSEGSTLIMDGTMEVAVFGGSIRFQDLRLEDYRGASPILAFSMDFERIDLERLTDVIPIGRIEGIVKGHSRSFRLALDPLEPYSFDVLIESDDSRKAPRKIGFDAVELFASMGDSNFDAYRGLLESAELYTYSRLGLWVRLKNDTIFARGLVKKGGHEANKGYFILGSGFKQVNLLVNTGESGYPYAQIKDVLLKRIGESMQEGGPEISFD